MVGSCIYKIEYYHEMYIMEYYSAIKNEWDTDKWYNVDRLWKHYGKWKKPVSKGHILYNSIYMKCMDMEIYGDKVD